MGNQKFISEIGNTLEAHSFCTPKIILTILLDFEAYIKGRNMEHSGPVKMLLIKAKLN